MLSASAALLEGHVGEFPAGVPAHTGTLALAEQRIPFPPPPLPSSHCKLWHVIVNEKQAKTLTIKINDGNDDDGKNLQKNSF